MTRFVARPMTYLGVKYPSISAVSRAAGCSDGKVHYFLRNGHDLDQLAAPKRVRRVPTLYRGVTYPSRQAAADAAGVSITTWQLCVKQGRNVDLLGVPRENPVTIRGVDYPSQLAAASALGVHPTAISNALHKHGHADRVGLGLNKAQPGNCNAVQAKPVRVGPHRFLSIGLCAKAVGRSRSWVTRRIDPNASPELREELLAAVMPGLVRAEQAAIRERARRAATGDGLDCGASAHG